MEKNYFKFLSAFVAAACVFLSATAEAQDFTRRFKSPVMRTAPVEGEMDVILLDSIIGETECYYYKYNEFGYLTSTKMYTIEVDEYGDPVPGGKWVFDNDEDVSLQHEYVFDDNGRCTRYSEYTFNTNGEKDKEVNRIEITYSGETRTEKCYYNYDDTNEMVLREEVTYDMFGNPSIIRQYDEEAPEMDDYEEYRYTGCILSYEDCENGNYDLSIDDSLFEKYCYYKVTCDTYSLNGWKFETDKNGKKVRYKIDEPDFDISNIGNIDALWVLDEEYQDYESGDGNGEDFTVEVPNATRSVNYETGLNIINVEDGDWLYVGDVTVVEVYNEETESYEKKIRNGGIRIRWNGNGDYSYTYPLYNYQFPKGVLDYNNYDWAYRVNDLYAFWNSEENRWEVEHHGGDLFYKHYTNDQGSVVEEYSKFVFNPETARMELVAGTTSYTTFSFDEQGRLTMVDRGSSKECFEYLNDTDYLKKRYMLDMDGNKNDVVNLYYSNGKYIWPFAGTTAVEEIADTSLRIDGNRVFADGEIAVYNLCGQLVAKGQGCVTVGNNGLYIVKTVRTAKKIFIK